MSTNANAKPHIVSYLSTLRFDDTLKNSLQARYLSNFRFVILLIISIVLLGSLSFVTIPRRLNPEIKIPIIIVSTVFPGAPPEDIEQLVTIPLEDKITSVDGIDTLSSVSSENSSLISIQFTSSTDHDKARSDVQTAVDSVIDLPTDVLTPRITLLDFEDQPVWTFALYTNQSNASLMRFAKNLRKKIEAVPQVDRVIVSGFDEQYIEVTFDTATLQRYGVSPFILSQLIKRSTASYPAGNVETDTSSFSLAIDPQITTIDDIRNVRLTVANQSLKLADIATVAEKSIRHQTKTWFADKDTAPKTAVEFSIYKTSNVNIDRAENAVREVVDTTLIPYTDTFFIKTITNTADQIAIQFADLFSEFRSTVVLVFILLFIFLGLKQATIASLTIPLTFLSAFAIIGSLGMSLNFLTMFAFLLSLGLLIDDTIVAVAAMTRYYRTGRFTPMQTGILVWKDFIVPLWSTTITTIWAFVPLLMSSGIIGEFIKPIPIVVTATMLSSTSIAVFITIPLMVIILKPQLPRRVFLLLKILSLLGAVAVAFAFSGTSVIRPLLFICWLAMFYIMYREKRQLFNHYVQKKIGKKTVGDYVRKIQNISENGLINIEKLSESYRSIITHVLESGKLRKQVLIGIGAFVIIAYMLVPFGLVKNEFFPKTDEDLLFVNIDLPVGTNENLVKEETFKMATVLKNTDGSEFIVAKSGQKMSSDQSSVNSQSSFGVTLHLKDAEERKPTAQDIAADLRDQFKDYQNGKVAVEELSGGPPAGADVQINLYGPDLTVLQNLADEVVGYLKKEPGIVNPDKSIKSGVGKLVFTPDKDALVKFGVDLDMLGLWIRTYASGFELDSLRVGNEDIKVSFQFSGILSPEKLGTIAIPTAEGYIPLTSLGKLTLENNPTQITRENGDRTISVFAGAATGFNINEKNTKLIEFVKTLNFPSGYGFKTGGVNEENAKSVQSILQAMIVAILLILITMIIEFQSFRQSFIALLIIPVSIAGVFYIFGLFGIPLSFPALIGVLALFGIVVTHAIVVIEKINDNIKEGLELEDAVIDAATNRLEPVLLTSLSTIVGLVPITLSDPLWRGLGGAIIAGLLFSGAIKLFLVPILYVEFFRKR